MDNRGTVWERKGTEWRVVTIRGGEPDDASFIDAWVSPTGAVIAITEKQVYRLN
jgi:hypothetical protein